MESRCRNQFGAPLRLIVPWKYGFKSVKSIVRISFTDERPVSFWEELAADEYGFWANVNPEVPHPRWSQATERMLGTDEQIPTQLYNGYGEEVAQLYAGMGRRTSLHVRRLRPCPMTLPSAMVMMRSMRDAISTLCVAISAARPVAPYQ